MEIDSSAAFCAWGILEEVLQNAIPVSLSCSAGSALEVATSTRCKMASKSQAKQDSAFVNECMISQEIMCFRVSGYFVRCCMFVLIFMPTFTCACVYFRECVQVTLKLPDQMCRSLDCVE